MGSYTYGIWTPLASFSPEEGNKDMWNVNRIMFIEDNQTVMTFTGKSVYAVDLAAENIKERAKLWSEGTYCYDRTSGMLISTKFFP